MTDGQIRSSSVGAVAVAEWNPDVVYIGMGEVQLRGNIMQGDGVYKSTDGGTTWRHTGLADTQVIARIRVHPQNPDLVYVAAFGHPAGPNEQRGVFRSKDGGKTWERILYRDAKTGAVDLAVDRNNPRVMFAALWEAGRVSWQLSSGGPGSGLFKSTDGGDTWTEITRNPGLPKGVVGKIGVAISGADSNRVWAVIEAADRGVFRSDDSGATWTRVTEERRLLTRAFYYTRIYADPKDRDTVYVLNDGFYKSTDGGKTWRTLEPPHGDNHDLWIDPTNPKRMVNSNDGGGNVSVNGGETWTAQDYPTAQLYHVATTKDVPYHVCGAQQDSTTVCVPSRDWDNLRMPRGTLGDWYYAVGGGESGYVTPHPVNSDLFYAGSQGALLTRYDRRTGGIRDIQPYPRFFSGEASSELPERWQWTFPIVFSPTDPHVLYTSSQHLWKTTDDGQSWTKISPDLTKADPKTLGRSGGPITGDMNGPEIFATIFTVAPSKSDPDTIWTGSDDGLIYVTRDGGKNWSNVTPPDLPELARISMIEASAHARGQAYFAAKRYLLDDRAPYLYRTSDYGQSWTKIVAGIRADAYAHSIREDPARPGLLYAGTEHGVWVSFDDGSSWTSLSLNLPDVQISDLVVEQHDLVVATHGRSFYVLDGIDMLRQLTPEVTAKELHLFEPADVYRRVMDANIDYYLKRAADKVELEILDSNGRRVRLFTGTPKDNAFQEDTSWTKGGRTPLLRPPGTRAGTNRFTWDLRYEGATVWPGIIIFSARPELGPMAVPGVYRVRVTANGETQETTLRLQLPRGSRAAEADLQAQFDLAMKIRDRTTEANEAVLEIRDIRRQVEERLGRTKDQRIVAAARGLLTKITAVEGDIYQVKNTAWQDFLDFPIKLNNRLASLRRVVETGDARPTDGAEQVFKELSAELDTHLKKLNDALGSDLAALNRLLAAAKLARVEPAARKTT